MANATSTQLQELYVAYFGRAADPLGLDYWVNDGVSTADFAASMYEQPEFNDVYGSLTIESQVNQIYLNLFDRQADVEGLTYWSREIRLGNLQLAQIAVDLIYAAQNNEGSEDDKTALINRTEAAEAYTAKVAEDVNAILAFQPLSNGLGDTPFSPGQNITLAKAYLSGIDKDTVFTEEGIASSVDAIAVNGVPATTSSFTLTELTDNFAGSSGKDVFQGVLVADKGEGTTITAGDTIDGGGGTSDTFNISVTGTSTDNVDLVGINADVEKILFSNFDLGSVDGDAAATTTNYDASLSSGLTTVGFINSSATGDTVFTGLQDIVDAEMTSGEADLTITHIDTAVSGDSDTSTLTLSSQTAGTFTETSATEGGLEILNVVSKGSANDVDITSARNTITTVNISGAEDLTTTVTSDAIETIEASTFTGELALTVAGDTDISVTSGSGDDTITLPDFGEDDTVDGGDGTDTLSVNVDVTEDSLVGVSNVEVLAVTGAKGITLAGDAGVMNFDLTEDASQTLTLNEGVTSAVTVTLGEAADDDIVNNTEATLTIKGTATAIAAQDLITGNEDATETIEITADDDEDGQAAINIAGLNITDVDTILVVDGGDGDDSGSDIEITTGELQTALTIDASALDAAISDDAEDAATEEVLIVIGTGSDGALTVTGGAGDDTITTGVVDDVIDGGAGDDTITSTSGDDNVSGGAGDDTFNFGSSLTEDDVVDGGDGTDKLIVTSLESGNLAGVTNVETLAFNGSTTLDADLAFDTIDLTTGDNADSVTFDSGYVNATTVEIDAGDTVVNDADITLSVTATAADLVAAEDTTITGSADEANDSMTITAQSDDDGADGGDDGDGLGYVIATAGQITKVNSITVVDAGDDESDGDDPAGDDFTIDLTGYATELTIDASALDAANQDNDDSGAIDSDDYSEEILTITGASDADLTVIGGSGADSIVASTANDNFTGGAGDDTFTFAANLSYLDVVVGGAGTDTISVSGEQADVNFMNVTGVEELTLDGAAANTLSSYFDASGITTVNLDNNAISVVIASGATNDITFVAKGAVNENVTAGLGNDVLTFTGDLLTTDDAFDGGTGTDTISLDNSAAAIDATVNLANVENVEKIVVSDADGLADDSAELINIDFAVLADNGVDNTDVSIEIDASVITDDNDAVTVDASNINDTDYSFTIKTGSAADSVTGSAGNDTITTGAEDDTIDGDDGDDVIDAGAGDDTITGGAGADTMTGGSGDDTFNINDVTHSTTADADVITDFTSGDDDLRTIITLPEAGEYDFTNKGEAANVSEAISLLSNVSGQYFFNTTTNQVMADTDGNGLIQSVDFAVTLSDVTELADSDLSFEITTLVGDASDVTTGAGADTVTIVNVGDVIDTGDGADTVKVAAAFSGEAELDLDAGAGDDILDINTTDAVTVALGALAGFETLDLDAAGTDVDLTITAAQFNAFDTITAAATDEITITTMDAVTISGSTAIDTYVFGETDDDAVISSFTTDDIINLDARVITTDAYDEAVVGDADFGAAGFFVIEDDVDGASATMDETDVADAINSFDNIGADEMAYLMFKADADVVSDAFIYHVTASDDGTAFASADLVATLTDVADLSDPAFTAANFVLTAG